MLDKLKKKMPGLYEKYQHLKRLSGIRRIKRIKKLPLEKQLKMLEDTYCEKIGHRLDWDNLHTYTEKMQWEKIYNKDPRKVILADKYAVRDWVSSKIGEEYLIPCLGVWEKFDDIDFDTLPNRFVLKTNHGTATNVIVKDKSKLNVKVARMKFNDWLRTDYGYLNGFELHYSQISPRIIAEAYMETESGELQDYKFLCFDGVPHFCWVDLGRYSNHTRTVFDMEWKLQEWTQADYGISKEPIPKPQNFDKMIEIAKVLSEGFAQVRVDLYNVNGNIYFGEMTFSNGRGFDRIVPEKYDRIIGDLWNLKTDRKG